MSYLKSGNAASKLRKGAWDFDEDALLRKCVEKYGEGKWHLVPQRAGLNRCRKSCRLRWLNYLRPTIKRGEFSENEVDLMIRLNSQAAGKQTPQNNNNQNYNKPLLPATMALNDEGIESQNLFAQIDIDSQKQNSLQGVLMASSGGSENTDAYKDLMWKTDESTTATMEFSDDLNGIWDLLNSPDHLSPL